MFRFQIVFLFFANAMLVALSAGSALAQGDQAGPLTQGDIDKFIGIYGSDDPSAAAGTYADLRHDRLDLVVRRLTAVYLAKGQHTDDEAVKKTLAAIADYSKVSQDEYNLVETNNDNLKPVFTKYLGTYTLRL